MPLTRPARFLILSKLSKIPPKSYWPWTETRTAANFPRRVNANPFARCNPVYHLRQFLLGFGLTFRIDITPPTIH
jgi:hypothetical protein